MEICFLVGTEDDGLQRDGALDESVGGHALAGLVCGFGPGGGRFGLRAIAPAFGTFEPKLRAHEHHADREAQGHRPGEPLHGCFADGTIACIAAAARITQQ